MAKQIAYYRNIRDICATPQAVGEVFSSSGKPGLGVDINEQLAAKNPLCPIRDGGAYPTDRTIGGTVVKPQKTVERMARINSILL